MNNNKLIAEFMGLPEQGNTYEDPYSGEYVEAIELSYDESWDWLMPVVESCFERLDARDNSADEIKRQLLVCNLKGVHTAVIEFIKTYN